MQKNWSNDSLTNMLKPTVLRNPPPVEIDRPRKHARRTSLPVRSERSGPSSSSAIVNTNGDSSNRHHSIERKRFRESIGRSVGSSSSSPSRKGLLSNRRRESAPSSSRPSVRLNGNGIQNIRGSKMFEIGEEGDDEDDDDDDEEIEDEDRNDTDDLGNDTTNSNGRFSALETSTTYAAGPSDAGRRRTIDDGSTDDDASSSERQAFDWDVPHKRVTPINANNGSAQIQQRSTYSYDSAERVSSPRRRSIQLNPTREGSCPSTPTKRNQELESAENSTGNAIGLGNLSQTNGKSGVSLNSVNSSKSTSKWRLPRLRWPSNPTIEGGMLVGASIVVAYRLYEFPDEATRTHACEVMSLVIGSCIYYLFLRGKIENGSIWATSLRQYRICGDDGAMLGLLLGPLLGVTCLFASLEDRPSQRYASGDGLPFPPWRVESPPSVLGNRTVPHNALTALALSRCTLLSLQTAMSTTLLVHLLATKYIRKPEEISTSSWKRLWSFTKFSFILSTALTLMREAFSWIDIPLWTGLTRGELLTCTLFFQSNLYTISQLARKSFTLGELSIVASVGVTLGLEMLNLTSARLAPGSTPYVKTFRRPTPLLSFQLALVVGTFMIGFLLSPLLYLSRHLAQKPVHRLRWPHKRDLHRRLLAFFFYLFATLYVIGVLGLWVYWVLGKRNPWIWTFQFVLSGQTWWSRPVLILYWIGLVSVTIAGWQATVLNGKRFRIRPSTSSSSSLTNGLNSSTSQHQITTASRLGFSPIGAPTSSANEPNLEGGVTKSKSITANTSNDISSVATNHLFPKRAAYLSLNARRKFFHALAVLMFAPGIAFDPAFMHLAFSLAFSIFVFAEYIRYYALYPFGAALHVFLSEFTDHKDSGPVILSHFYLLSGCAGGLWIDGLHGTSTKAGQSLIEKISMNNNQLIKNETIWTSLLGTWNWYENHASFSNLSSSLHLPDWTTSKGNVDISMFIGVLTLGIGDALASIIGRRYGRIRWPNSGKTLEGTIAFVVSIFISAVILRLIGWCSPFSLIRFGMVSIFLGLFEGISNQNDNLILPIYGLIALSVMQV